VFKPPHQNIGHFSTYVEFSFEDPVQDRYFIILRSIKAVLGNQAEYDAIRPTAQYEGRQRRRHENISDSQVVPGERPADLSRHPYGTKLKQYQIPIDLEDALNNGPQDLDAVMKRLPAKYNSTVLNKKTHISILKTQLWVEEYKAK
jgi:helicase MOV-10